MNKYNFAYSNSHNPSTPEHAIIERLSNNMLYQTELIEELFKKEFFSWEDVANLYAPCEACEACEAGNQHECDNTQPCDIYAWVAYADESERTRRKLDDAGWPYIYNDFGFWIARTDWGSAQKIYFLPALAEALYNDKN